MKVQCATFVLLLIFLFSSYSLLQLTVAAGSGAFCDSKCRVRCSKASLQERCLNFCRMCCQACKCVPSGTYGNKDECPCYRDKSTGVGRRKRPKCP